MTPEPKPPLLLHRPASVAETWQGGLFLFPSWIMPDDGTEPFRPWIASWVHAQSRYAFNPAMSKSGGRDPSLLLVAYRSTLAGRRRLVGPPARLQVKDPEAAEILREALVPEGVEVELVESLPNFDYFREELLRELRRREPLPTMLDRPGVTPERIALFAEAAAAFHRTDPWDRLDDEDPILIDSPQAEPGMRLAVVIGSAGESFGLVFMESEEQYLSIIEEEEHPDRIMRLSGYWGISFDRPHDMPTVEHDLWIDLDLPLAAPDAYPIPMALGPGKRIRRPDARQLAYFEGLLRALAEATDDDLDSGRWRVTVETASGPMSFSFELPNLLNPDGDLSPLSWDEPAFLEAYPCVRAMPEGSPVARARLLADAAYEAYGRRKLKLLRQALAIDPDCVEARVTLASRQNRIEKKIETMRQAKDAGRRALSNERNANEKPRIFAAYLDTRWILGHTLYRSGRLVEAAGEFAEMLDEDLMDHMNVRDRLLPLLILLQRDSDARALLERYPPESFAEGAMSQALLSFRRDGAGETSDGLLKSAIQETPGLAGAILEKRRTDPQVELYPDIVKAWRSTPGAYEWLKSKWRRERRAGKKAASGRRRSSDTRRK